MKERKRLTLAEQHMNSCVHFTGLRDPRCKAGVRYEDVRAEPPSEDGRPAHRGFAIPCLANDGGSKPCEHRRFPTREEAEAYEREVHAETEQVMEARKRIIEQTKGERGVRGSVECPRCGKRLGYTVSSYNGHVWGRCESEGCLAWME